MHFEMAEHDVSLCDSFYHKLERAKHLSVIIFIVTGFRKRNWISNWI